MDSYEGDLKLPRRPSAVQKKSYSSKICVLIDPDFDDPDVNLDDHDLVEPDIGDQRQSRNKALPARPTTPKSVLHKYRVSAICPFAFAALSFALALVLLLAGHRPGSLETQFLVALNTSRVGQNVIRFEPADSMTATNNLLNNITDTFDAMFENMTATIDDSLQNGMSQVVTTIVENTGIQDQYILYIQGVCEGDAEIDKCTHYGDIDGGLSSVTNDIKSSVVIGSTNVSIPLLAQLGDTISTLSSIVSGICRAIFAFLVISLIGSGATILLSLAAIFFPAARILVYTPFLTSALAVFFSFMSAVLLTILVAGIVGMMSSIGDAISLNIQGGSQALTLVWLSWMFVFFANCYWLAIWFVEVRSWAFVKRARTAEQKGDWRGASRELKDDFKGKSSNIPQICYE